MKIYITDYCDTFLIYLKKKRHTFSHVHRGVSFGIKKRHDKRAFQLIKFKKLTTTYWEKN